MRVADEADDVEQRDEWSAVLCGDAGRDVERAHGLGQVRSRDSRLKEDEVTRSRKGCARNDQAGYLAAQLSRKLLAGAVVVSDQSLGGDADLIRGVEGDLGKVVERGVEYPRTHLYRLNLRLGAKVGVPHQLGERTERVEREILGWFVLVAAMKAGRLTGWHRA